MEFNQEVLTHEKDQLNKKIESLESFVESDDFKKMSAVQMSLINVQLSAMRTYSQCLVEHLAHN